MKVQELISRTKIAYGSHFRKLKEIKDTILMASALALLYAKLSAKVLAVTSLSFLMAQMDLPLNSVSE